MDSLKSLNSSMPVEFKNRDKKRQLFLLVDKVLMVYMLTNSHSKQLY